MVFGVGRRFVVLMAILGVRRRVALGGAGIDVVRKVDGR